MTLEDHWVLIERLHLAVAAIKEESDPINPEDSRGRSDGLKGRTAHAPVPYLPSHIVILPCHND
jgi:hypothetical protein